MKNIDTSEVFKGVNLSDAERTLVESKFNVLSVKKGDIILSEGQYVPFQYFVSEGCLRTFFIGKDGKEFTLQFAIKDWWISDYTAFFMSIRLRTALAAPRARCRWAHGCD